MAIKHRNRLLALLLGVGISFVAWAGLETGTYISDLVATNPLSSDLASTGDDHIRLIKSTVKATFPNVNSAVTATDEVLSAAAATNVSNTWTAVQLLPSGSSGAPSLSFSGDTDTGYFRAAANSATLAAGGQDVIQYSWTGTSSQVTLGTNSTSTMFINNSSTATANAGSNGAPPAQVAGYLQVTINGTARKIPYYAN